MLASMTHLVAARLCASSIGVRYTVTVSLTYACDDPLAVHLTFPADASRNDAPATWTFARGLLAAGLHTRAGVGDVQVGPHDERWVTVSLTAPEGAAVVELDRRGLQRFLAHAFAAVPATEETRRLAVDALIESLLAPG
ncbi:SsgA family sporulation/cell division regulator [Streptomyces sp. NPDC003016]